MFVSHPRLEAPGKSVNTVIMKSWQALILSLAMHAMLVAALLPFHLTKPTQFKPAPIEVEILRNESPAKPESLKAEATITAKATESKSAARTVPHEKSSPNSPKLAPKNSSKAENSSNLQSLLSTPYNSARPSSSNTAESENIKDTEAPGTIQNAPRGRSGAWEEGSYSGKDDPSVAWGAGSGTFDRVQDLVLMSKFQKKIDAMLFYPGVLARRKISGIVNTRIVLNSKGDCDWHRTQINAAEPHLRIYILHLLKKVCTENFARYTRKRELTNIDMSFHFEISEDRTSKELIETNQSVIGNVLVFYRQSRNSIAEWHLGPLTGVFPIPWVTLDFDWVMEHFESLVEKKDPLGEFKSGTND